MLEKFSGIFRRGIGRAPKGEVVSVLPSEPTVEQRAELRDAVLTKAPYGEPSEADVNEFFANLEPLTPDEAIMTQNEIIDLAHEMYPTRKPHQAHLKI